jgi:hypothetical protein
MDQKLLDYIQDDNFYAFIGSSLLQILLNCDLIETYLVTIQGKRFTYLKVTNKISDKFELNKLHVVPLKLPMIVKPKEYGFK